MKRARVSHWASATGSAALCAGVRPSVKRRMESVDQLIAVVPRTHRKLYGASGDSSRARSGWHDTARAGADTSSSESVPAESVGVVVGAGTLADAVALDPAAATSGGVTGRVSSADNFVEAPTEAGAGDLAGFQELARIRGQT